MTSATRSSSPRPAARVGPDRASAGSRSCPRSSTRSSPRSANDRSGRRIRPRARRPSNRRANADLTGRHIVVSAGGTREPIDPVRFIGNRSTGKMGVAVAEAALARAPASRSSRRTSRSRPRPKRRRPVESAAELRTALHRLTHRRTAGRLRCPGHGRGRGRLPAGHRGRHEARARRRADARAGGDPRHPRPDRADRARPDRAGEAATSRSPAPVPRRLRRRDGLPRPGRRKLRRKGVDLLVANDVAEPGSGFGTDTNRVTILAPDGGRTTCRCCRKREVADRLLDRIARALDDATPPRRLVVRHERT